MVTTVIGDGVTNSEDAKDWGVRLILPGSAGAKVADQKDTELKVSKTDNTVGFRTNSVLFQLDEYLVAEESDSKPPDAYYKSSTPLDIFSVTKSPD
jgi:hypothetical protein